MRASRRASGFTLVELTVAMTLLAIVVSFVYITLNNTLRGQEMVRRGLEGPKIQNALLGQIFRDFRYIYWPDFVGNAGFLGRKSSVSNPGGGSASRVDFVTSRPTRFSRPEDTADSSEVAASPLAEVGYAPLANGNYISLWRREDFFVDDDPTDGGVYTQVYDRLKRFSLTFFPNPREQTKDHSGLEEWDSRMRRTLPYAVIVEIEFDVEEDAKEPQKITRIVLLRAGGDDIVEWSQGQQQPGQQPGGQQQPGR